MAVVGRRSALAALAGGLFLCVGCDLASLAYFLAPEMKDPGTIKTLASKDEAKVPRVLILTYGGLETRAEFIQADRQVADLLARCLRESAELDKEKLTVVPQRRVEEYKNAHPEWRQDADFAKIGKAFDVDYVIYLEFNSLSMYEERSNNQLYRGRASINVTLIDVKNPDDPVVGQEAYVCVYPSDARGAVAVDFDMPPVRFRQLFLTRVAQELSWRFATHHRRNSSFVE
jgi:hypothetical protein